MKETHEVNMDIKMTDTNKKEVVEMFKKLMTWEELEAYNISIEGRWSCYIDDNELGWAKKLYEDPELIVKKDEKVVD